MGENVELGGAQPHKHESSGKGLFFCTPGWVRGH